MSLYLIIEHFKDAHLTRIFLKGKSKIQENDSVFFPQNYFPKWKKTDWSVDKFQSKKVFNIYHFIQTIWLKNHPQQVAPLLLLSHFSGVRL